MYKNSSMPRKLSVTVLSLLIFAAALFSATAHSQSNPSSFTTGYRYDAGSRLVGTIKPDPDDAGPIKFAAVRNTYNGQGMLSRVETGELSTWQSESVLPAAWSGFTVFQQIDTSYDNWGRKLTEQVSSGGIAYSMMQYSYDSAGRVQCTAQRMNPAAYGALPASACNLGSEGAQGPDRITMQTYDSLSRVTQVQKAFGTPQQINYATYTYNGPLQSAKDANGNYSYYTYDGLVRLKNWYFPSPTSVGQYNSADYEQYGYDANGNRVSLRKRDGRTITYNYDALNRLRAEIYPAGTNADLYFNYDLRNLQLYARFWSDTGYGVTSSFDGFGRLQASSTNQSGAYRTLSYLNDSEGNRKRIIFPDGQYFNYDYDGLNRLKTITENGITPVASLTYNNQGRRQGLARGAGVTSTGYSYDPVLRLGGLAQDLAGTAYDESRGFTYNPANQIASRFLSNSVYSFTQNPAVTTTYAVNGLNQYTGLTSGTTTSPTHDANGNMTWDGTATYYYDILNRMTGATGGKTVNLSYDPKGRLFQTSGGTSGTTQFLYDGDALVAEYSSTGTILRRYVHGSGVDEPLVEYEGPTVSAANRRYYHADQQGSVIAEADFNGNALRINTYDPYGVPATGNATRFQYTGQIMLPDSPCVRLVVASRF